MDWKFLVEGGLFVLIGVVLTLFFNRRKTASEAVRNETDAEKLQAETELTRARTLLELQDGMLAVQKALEDMRVKNEEMYKSRELERNAKREEIERIFRDLQLVKENLSMESARNFSLLEELKKMKLSTYEKEYIAQEQIKKLQDQLATHGEQLVEIKKKTGSLEDKMPRRNDK